MVMIYKSEDRDELFKALGAAMTSWQHIETGLYVIAHCILGTDQKLSAIAFFHIKSGETKLTLVDKLCAVGIPPKAYEEVWKPLRKAISGHLTTRNHMAHYEASWFDLPSAQGTTEYSIMISAHHLQPEPQKSTMVTVLFVEELRALATTYNDTMRDLLRFAVKHCPEWPRHAASLPPRLQQALQTFHSEASLRGFEPPPEPSGG